MALKNTTTSADGTTIAFGQFGSAGDPIVLIGGALRSPVVTPALAEKLGSAHAAVYYDRRGRGDSGDSPSYSVDRELEDLRAVIADVGGIASVYGHSSGSGLALHAVAQGLPIKSLVLHDPPYSATDDERLASRAEAKEIRAALSENKHATALKTFLSSMGLPPEVIEQLGDDQTLLDIAPTIPYDFEVLDDGFDGRPTFLQEAAQVTIPTLVLASPSSWTLEMCRQVVDALPNGEFRELKYDDTITPPEVLAPTIAAFLTR